MSIRSAFWTAAAIAMLAAPVYAGSLSGKVVAVDDNSITVMKDGQSTVYVLPPGLEIRSGQNQPMELGDLRGRMVTLTIEEPTQPETQTQQAAQPKQNARPTVTNIRIDGDLEVDSETEVQTDD